MPARNYSVITESPINQPSDASNRVTQNPVFSERTKRGNTNVIRGSGDSARAAHLTVGAEGVVDTVSRALNVVIRVEVNKHDLEGKTFNYGFTGKLSDHYSCHHGPIQFVKLPFSLILLTTRLSVPTLEK